MEIQILKKEYKDAIRKDVFLKAKIAAVNEVSTWTVDRWRTENDRLLTTATNLGIIRRHLKIPMKECLTEAVEVNVENSEADHVSVG